MKVPIAVAGSIAQRPGYGGHAWALLQWTLGCRDLGYEPIFIDRLPPGTRGERNRAARWLRAVMARLGLEDCYSLLADDGSHAVGLSRAELIERVARSPLIVNVMGFLDDVEILAAAPRRVFLDIDPGFGQMWRELGLADVFRGHDDFVTVGESIGDPDCGIPTCGLDWITTPPPVALDLWPAEPTGQGPFTTIGSWRGPYDAVEFRGKKFGLRAHEFRRFMGLPGATRRLFEAALDIDDADQPDIELLRKHAWLLADPRRVAGDLDQYRAYIQGSMAELMVAKSIYVDTRSGWFSDRSACYLASAKPVLAQDTGFGRHHSVGQGLLSFADLDEAVAGVEEICGDYERHSRAARAIAEDEFDARKVVDQLLAKLGVR